jgi:ribosomal protein L24E
VVAVGATPDGKGYWQVASDGGVFGFGDAKFYGSTGNMHLNQPIVGVSSTPDGKGYWLVASDGGIFSFGDANFYGSTSNLHLNKPVVGVTATADGHGYWMVASDGGIFAFGDAGFHGSMGDRSPSHPVTGVTATADGHGYWMVASDGGVFSFGDAPYYGSDGGRALNSPVIGLVANGPVGYQLVMADGQSDVERLEEEHSDLVAQRASELQAAADGDHRNGAPRGRAYVRRLQELAIDDPDMGIAVGRSLHLEHVVEELLAGISVDGVPGIGPDGHELPPNRRHTARRRGAWMLALSALLLLVEAVIADGIGSILLYIWTVVGLGTFFLGGYLVLLGDKTPQAPS